MFNCVIHNSAYSPKNMCISDPCKHETSSRGLILYHTHFGKTKATTKDYKSCEQNKTMNGKKRITSSTSCVFTVKTVICSVLNEAGKLTSIFGFQQARNDEREADCRPGGQNWLNETGQMLQGDKLAGRWGAGCGFIPALIGKLQAAGWWSVDFWKHNTLIGRECEVGRCRLVKG